MLYDLQEILMNYIHIKKVAEKLEATFLYRKN
jgi:hypothetical protein